MDNMFIKRIFTVSCRGHGGRNAHQDRVTRAGRQQLGGTFTWVIYALCCLALFTEGNNFARGVPASSSSFLTKQSSSLATKKHEGCHHNGTNFSDGSMIPTMEPCLLCKCSRNMLTCALRICPELPIPPPRNCIVVHRSGLCCPHLSCSKLHVTKHGEDATDRKVIKYQPNDHNSLKRSDDEIEVYDDTTDMCIHNGTVYELGSAMTSSSLCSYCFCINGRQRCVKPKCLLAPNGCRPIFINASCCPVRYDCSGKDENVKAPGNANRNQLESGGGKRNRFKQRGRGRAPRGRGCFVNGNLIPEGQKIPNDSEKPCDGCFCIRGAVKCTPKMCAPSLRNCKPIVKKGECCAASYDCGTTPTPLIIEKTKPRQFGFLSMLLGLDDTENSTNAYPLDRTPPEVKTKKHDELDDLVAEEEGDEEESDEISVPLVTSSSNSSDTSISSNTLSSSTTEKSFFDVLREGLDMIDNNSAKIGTIIDESTPNNTKVLEPVKKPSGGASFLDLLLGPDDDDEEYDMWIKNQTMVSTAAPGPNIYYTHDDEGYDEHERFKMPPLPVIIKPQSHFPIEATRAPQVEQMTFIPLKTTQKLVQNDVTTKAANVAVTTVSSTTAKLSTSLKPSTAPKLLSTTTNRPSSATTTTTTAKSTTTKLTTIQPTTTTIKTTTKKVPPTTTSSTTTNSPSTTKRISTTIKPVTQTTTTTKVPTTSTTTTIKRATTTSKSTTLKPTTPKPTTAETTKPTQTTAKPTQLPKQTIKLLTSKPSQEKLKPHATVENSDYQYDYNDPTLPPSLPNLKIIPFLPTDAVKNDHKKVPYIEITDEANKRIDSPSKNENIDDIFEPKKNVPDKFGGVVKFVNTKYKTGAPTVSHPPNFGISYDEIIKYAPGEYNSENPLLLYRFSPPTKTEGGFKPRDPSKPNNGFYYDSAYETPTTHKITSEITTPNTFDSDLASNIYSIDDSQKDSYLNYNSSYDNGYDDDLDIISITTDTPPQLPANVSQSSSDDSGFFGSVLNYFLTEGDFSNPLFNATIKNTTTAFTIPDFKTLPSLPKVPEMFDSDEIIEKNSPTTTTTLAPSTTPAATTKLSTTTVATSTEKRLPVYSFKQKLPSAVSTPSQTIKSAPKIENINLLFPHQASMSANQYKIIHDHSTEPYTTNLAQHSTKHVGAEISTKPAHSVPGLLKLAGCNIYGQMYRLGKIISELSSPCLECKCTEVGVNCMPLSC